MKDAFAFVYEIELKSKIASRTERSKDAIAFNAHIIHRGRTFVKPPAGEFEKNFFEKFPPRASFLLTNCRGSCIMPGDEQRRSFFAVCPRKNERVFFFRRGAPDER